FYVIPSHDEPGTPGGAAGPNGPGTLPESER
ncbi:baseplate protein, partial [Streptomyces sp. NRRL F-6602]